MADNSNSFYDAFNRLFAERKSFERIAFFQIGNEEEARDIVSRCFMSMWEHKDTLREDEMKSYMFISVKNACMDYRRANTRHKKIFDDLTEKERGLMEFYSKAIESLDHELIFRNEVRSIMFRTMEQLPGLQKKIFILSRVNGLSYKEIAGKLGLSYKQVDKSLQKTMKTLRAALDEYLK